MLRTRACFLLFAAFATAASSASFTAPLRVAVLQIARGSGNGLTPAAQALRQSKSTTAGSAQIAVLPGRFLDLSALAVDALAPIARELAMGVLSTGETADGTHAAVLIGPDGSVLLNRTVPAGSALDCGGGGGDHGGAAGVENDGFAVAKMVLPTTNGSGVNGSTELSVGVLLDREWECFHGSRVLMLRGADLVLVAGSGLPPSDGAPQLALRTRAWENVLAVVLAQSATYGGSQAYLGVKVTECGCRMIAHSLQCFLCTRSHQN